jgi:phage terminase large subunit-like protein
MKTKTQLTQDKLTVEQEVKLFRLFASWSKKRKYEYIKKCPKERAFRLKYTWAAWARDSQIAPDGDWSTWCVISGRGWGKTRTGAEWVIEKAYFYPGCHIALVGRTVADVRDVMIKGRSGILAVSPPWFMPTYYPSKRQLVWPNGTTATTYSADEPDQLRGPQHSFAWADERAAWQYDDAFDQLSFGLRIEPAAGVNPQCVVTTTPRNTKAMKDLVSDPSTVVTKRSTYENKENLSPRFIREIERRYAGTRLGRQEIEGDIIDDIDGALWKRAWIERDRVRSHPELKRIVVAIDPPAASSETSDDPAEAGIIVAGLGIDDHGYVLADYSLIGTPNEWASAALKAYSIFEANSIVGEVNNGGDMVGAIVRNIAKEKQMGHIHFKAVRATRGKQLRAEPVSDLYQRGLIHHVGVIPDTEDQQCNWVPGMKSPDRLDALVWAFTELMVRNSIAGGMSIDTDGESQGKHKAKPLSEDVHEEEYTFGGVSWR